MKPARLGTRHTTQKVCLSSAAFDNSTSRFQSAKQDPVGNIFQGPVLSSSAYSCATFLGFTFRFLVSIAHLPDLRILETY